MQSEIKIGQRFNFNILSDPSQERLAVVTRVLSDREQGFGPEVDFYFAYWVEAHELPETEAPTTLVFQRAILIVTVTSTNCTVWPFLPNATSFTHERTKPSKSSNRANTD